MREKQPGEVHEDEVGGTGSVEILIIAVIFDNKVAQGACNQQNGIVKYLKEHDGEISLTQVGGLMISYGWK